MEECIADKKRLEKFFFSKQKVTTFVNKDINNVAMSGKGKPGGVRMERDLFRSILYLAL